MEKSMSKYYEIKSKVSNFYTGNKLVWSLDGQLLYCMNFDEISIVSVEKGTKIGHFDLKNDMHYEAEMLLTFDISVDNKLIITAHKSGCIKLWSLMDGVLKKQWKSNHNGNITKLIFNPCNKIICSTGIDSTIRIWDYMTGRIISNIEGECVYSVILFHPDVSSSMLYAAGADNVIYYWNYSTKKLLHSLRGHISQITSMAFYEDNMQFLASVSVDKVLILWKLSDGSQLKVFPFHEALQGVVFLPDTNKDNFIIATVGVSGGVYIVSYNQNEKNNIIHKNVTQAKKLMDCIVVNLIHCKKTNQIAIVSVDHNIYIYNLSSLKCVKQLIGYNDEILDICYLENNLAMATNSNLIKLYNLISSSCKILAGHTNTILTLSSYKNYLISAGKDFMIFIWRLDPLTSEIKRIAKCIGHTSAIGSISLSFQNLSLLGSASQDGCLKLWNSSMLLTAKEGLDSGIILKNSVKAHEKEINCVTFSPNNILMATASQDKTIKVWNTDLRLLSTLRGHRKGVWSVRFSPADQILISASSDCSIRIWSLSSLNCLTKIEEECSILRVEFLPGGSSIISAAADGIIKIRNIKTTESICILDEHKNRVWALTISSDGSSFHSGGADSELICWKDVTEKKCNENILEKIAESRQSQILNNLLKETNFEKAFMLALTLNKPLIALKTISNFIKRRFPLVIDINHTFNTVQFNNLQTHMKSWNTNTRYFKVAQFLLYAIINVLIFKRLDFINSNKFIEDIRPYTERHYKRTSLYVRDINFLDFTVNCM